MPRCPFLAACAERLARASADFEELVVDMRPDQAVWRPAPGAWSVAECIDHVNVTARLYLAGIRPAIERARAVGLEGSAPYGRGTFLGRQVLRVLEPGANRRFPAPRKFRPAGGDIDFTAVRNGFRAVHASLSDLIEEADGLALGRVRFANPAIPLFQMTAAHGFEILSLHAQRHLAQAEAVTRADGYPRAPS